MKSFKEKTLSWISPKGGEKGCLCDDGNYRKECCNGTLANQGIGSTTGGVETTVIRTNSVRTIVSES
jgi:hypothetical protein